MVETGRKVERGVDHYMDCPITQTNPGEYSKSISSARPDLPATRTEFSDIVILACMPHSSRTPCNATQANLISLPDFTAILLALYSMKCLIIRISHQPAGLYS